jgi:hypothetical protein
MTVAVVAGTIASLDARGRCTMAITPAEGTQRPGDDAAVVRDLSALMNAELESIAALGPYKRDAESAKDEATADLFGQIEQRMREDVGRLQEVLVQHQPVDVLPHDFVMPKEDDEVDN